VREALQALESEGTLFAGPYAGALVRPLSPAEIAEIAEVRLALIALALKPAHAYLALADFDLACDLAKRITRTKSAKEAFECARRFWDIIFQKAERPNSLGNVSQIERSHDALLSASAASVSESRPRQHEALIELYRKGKFEEAFRSFKKIYLKIVGDAVDHLEAQ
jgi:DNA-binding GntR family transcriptional regulator